MEQWQELTDEEFEAIRRAPYVRPIQRVRPITRPDPSDVSATAAWLLSPVVGSRKRVREFLFDQFGDVCAICETPIDRGNGPKGPASPEIDHVIPTARGGDHVWGNIRLAHRVCNQHRNDLRDGEPDPAEAREFMAAALYRVAHPEIYVPIELARWEPHLARIQAEVEANAELVTDAIELGLDEGAITKRREELAWSERSLAFVAGKMEQIRAKLDR